MQEVNKNTEQLSGLVDIYAVPTTNIMKIENKVVSCYNQDNVFRFMATMESISHQQNMEQTKPGQLHKPKISFYIPGQTTTNDKILNKMKIYKYVVVVRDQEGNHYLIGNIEQNLNLEYDYANSANYSGSKGYNIDFSGELTEGMKPVNYPFTYV